MGRRQGRGQVTGTSVFVCLGAFAMPSILFPHTTRKCYAEQRDKEQLQLLLWHFFQLRPPLLYSSPFGVNCRGRRQSRQSINAAYAIKNRKYRANSSFKTTINTTTCAISLCCCFFIYVFTFCKIYKNIKKHFSLSIFVALLYIDPDWALSLPPLPLSHSLAF